MAINITPLEIRQKRFERALRGYDKEEVENYLDQLSQAWERILAEQRELHTKLDNTEREVQKLREIESSLFKTLKTAEDTSHNMIDQAQKQADLQLREAQLKVDALIKDARWKARNIVEDAEDEAKQTYNRLHREVKSLEREYRDVETQRDNLIGEVKNLAKDALARVERAELKASKNNLLFSEARTLDVTEAEVTAPRTDAPPADPLPIGTQEPAAPEEHTTNVREEVTAPDDAPRREGGSFFDALN